MNLRHFRIFLAVCDSLSMTAAAKTLYISQPSISQAIAELERYYGVRLFERLNHKLYQTSAGARLQSYALHILNLEEQARKELAGYQSGGSLRIGASLTIGAYLMPQLVAAFRKQKPEVSLFTTVENTREIEKMLLADQIDFGLVEGLITSADILEETMRMDELVIVCGPENSLGQEKGLRVTDLQDQPFIIRESGSGTRILFEFFMNEAGVRWKTAGVYNNIEALKQAVKQDLGLGILPKIAIVAEEINHELIPLDITGLVLKRKFNLVYHQQKYLTPAMQTFRQICLK